MNKKILGLSIATLAFGAIALTPNLVDAYQGNPSVKGPNYSPERHQAMEKAFETNDYNAWKNLMQNRGRVTQRITQENFSKLAQAHKLADEGKLDEAKKIRQELGLGLGQGRKLGFATHR